MEIITSCKSVLLIINLQVGLLLNPYIHLFYLYLKLNEYILKLKYLLNEEI